MDTALDCIDRVNGWIGRSTGVLVLFSAAVIVYEIFVRFLLQRPTVWANESTIFACCIVYMLAGAWVMIEDKHVRIDVLYSRLSARRRALLDCLTYPFFALYIVTVLWASLRVTAESIGVRETTMSPWDPPIYPMKIVMTIGLLLLLVQGTAKLIRNLRTVLDRRVG